MVQFFSLSVVKVVGLGFLCGLIGSWFLTSPASPLRYSGRLNTVLSKTQEETILDVQQFKEHGGHHEGETLLMDKLAKEKPIFAFIFTSKEQKESRANHIKSTWAQRINKYLFFSDSEDPNLPAVVLPKAKAWALTRLALVHVHDNYLQNFLFFLKVADTNYVVVENLRALLLKMDHNEPLLIGRRLTGNNDNSSFLSDESGYVMSRSALEKIVTGIKSNNDACMESDEPADINLAKCATAVGVKLVHAVDQNKSDFFHPLSPSEMLNKFVKTLNPNQTDHSPTQMSLGVNCCSDQSITFSNLKGAQFYLMEYMIYHIYPYGVIRDPENYKKLAALRGSKQQ